MKIYFNKMKTASGNVYVSLDGGKNYTEYTAEQCKNGIELADDQDYSKVRVKGDNSVLTSLEVFSDITAGEPGSIEKKLPCTMFFKENYSSNSTFTEMFLTPAKGVEIYYSDMSRPEAYTWATDIYIKKSDWISLAKTVGISTSLRTSNYFSFGSYGEGFLNIFPNETIYIEKSQMNSSSFQSIFYFEGLLSDEEFLQKYDLFKEAFKDLDLYISSSTYPHQVVKAPFKIELVDLSEGYMEYNQSYIEQAVEP